MPDIDLDALEALAKAATQGPWVRGNTSPDQVMLIGRGGKGDYICHVQIKQFGGGAVAAVMEPAREANASLILKMHPPTVLALIEEIRRLRAALEECASLFVVGEVDAATSPFERMAVEFNRRRVVAKRALGRQTVAEIARAVLKENEHG